VAEIEYLDKEVEQKVDNKTRVLNLVKERFKDPKVVAGIMGNIAQETGNTFDYKQKQVGGGSGEGLFQFEGGFKDGYKKYLTKNKKEDSDVSQLDFMKSVLEKSDDYDIGGGHREKVQEAFKSGDIDKITEEFSNKVLRPGKPQIDKRKGFANEFIEKPKSEFQLNKLNPFYVGEAEAADTEIEYLDQEIEYLDEKPSAQEKAKEYIGTKIIQHPLQAIFNPAMQTLTGKSLQDRMLEASAPIHINPESSADYWVKFLKNAAFGMAGSVGDIATTPVSYVPIPGAKLIGKIPIRGTTLSEIAKRVPVSQILNKDISTIVKYQKALQDLPKTVAASAKPLAVSEQINPLNKVMKALEEAEPLRELQDKLYTIARSKRAATLTEVVKGKPGEEGYIAQLSSLKGPLPKVAYKGIRDQLSQADVDYFFKTIEDNAVLTPYEKINAKNGMAMLFGKEGSGLPQPNQLDLLSQIFPKKFIDTIVSKKPAIEKFMEASGEVLNLPRAIMSTADLSAPLRQGVFFVGRPRQFLPAFKNMFGYFSDEKAYQGLLENIKRRPTYLLMKDADLPLTDLGKSLTKREEAFMSRLPEHIPLFGHLQRASNRAYSGFLNQLRADVFDDLIRKAEIQGKQLTHKEIKNIGEFIGAATGRGKLPKSLESAAVAMNGIFFSPRLIASRMTLLNPQFYTKLDPFTRREALKSLFSFTGVAGTVMTLAAMGGADIETDARNANFGKIKIDNTRYDILGGFQQYIRLATQLITGEMISSSTGVKTTLGEGYKPITRLDILGRFVQSKEAPIASMITDILKGKTFTGEDVKIPEEVASRFVPMIAQDMADLVKDRGIEDVGMIIPGIFGVGVQTYSPSPTELVYSARSIKNYTRLLLREGKIEEANDFFETNREIFQEGQQLEQYQKTIEEYKLQISRIKNNVRIPEDEKKDTIFLAEERIKALQGAMQAKADLLKNLKVGK
jgi:hypothetical protein